MEALDQLTLRKRRDLLLHRITAPYVALQEAMFVYQPPPPLPVPPPVPPPVAPPMPPPVAPPAAAPAASAAPPAPGTLPALYHVVPPSNPYKAEHDRRAAEALVALGRVPTFRGIEDVLFVRHAQQSNAQQPVAARDRPPADDGQLRRQRVE